jgi:hypothetical protein
LRFRRCISGFILTLAFVHSLGAQQLAMSADQTQVVTALTAMFAAAQVDDLAKFNSLVSPVSTCSMAANATTEAPS